MRATNSNELHLPDKPEGREKYRQMTLAERGEIGNPYEPLDRLAYLENRVEKIVDVLFNGADPCVAFGHLPSTYYPVGSMPEFCKRCGKELNVRQQVKNILDECIK